MVIQAKLVTATGAPAMPYIKKEMAKLRAEIKSIEITLPIEIKKLGAFSGKLMAERVRRMTKRAGSTGELAEALENSMYFRKRGSFGYESVMTTAGLPEYWAMINYGGYISPETLTGFWSDNGGRSNAQLAGGKGRGTFYANKNGYLMSPASPIKGFHYILHAYKRIVNEMRSGKFTHKVIPSMK